MQHRSHLQTVFHKLWTFHKCWTLNGDLPSNKRSQLLQGDWRKYFVLSHIEIKIFYKIAQLNLIKTLKFVFLYVLEWTKYIRALYIYIIYKCKHVHCVLKNVTNNGHKIQTFMAYGRIPLQDESVKWGRRAPVLPLGFNPKSSLFRLFVSFYIFWFYPSSWGSTSQGHI